MSEKNYHWHRVASLYEIDNDFVKENDVVSVSVSGKKFCIGKQKSVYFAIDDTCPHAGGSLGEGWCDTKGNVICPYHRIGFRLSDGGPATGKGYYVNSYPTELRGDGLYVGIKKKWWEF